MANSLVCHVESDASRFGNPLPSHDLRDLVLVYDDFPAMVSLESDSDLGDQILKDIDSQEFSTSRSRD
jgi:hypothetical protein